MIYFDNAATTKQFKEVTDYISYISDNYYGNPASLHGYGYESEKLVEQSRTKIASILAVDPGSITFTSGGTESDNTAILGYLSANPRKGKHIFTTKIEHPAVYEVYKKLEAEGYEVTWLDVDENGHIFNDQLENSIRVDTALISIILVNNEIGTIQNIETISRIRNKKNINTMIFADAVQGFGKIKIQPAKSGIDMMSISGHKIHGPKGVGALYIKKGLKVNPHLTGGGQERSLRSGTLNVPGICGLGMAADMIDKDLKLNYNKVLELKKHFSQRILENFSTACINGNVEEGTPYILNVSFPGLKSEVLLHHLAEKEIYVSSGSACSSKQKVRSHVLEAIGAGNQSEGAIRFSFSINNTKEEVDVTVDALKNIIPIITYRGGK
jgi:cysteine desulfurase